MLPGQQICPLSSPHAHSQPSPRLPLQSPKPVLHVVKEQAPAEHVTAFAFWRLVAQFVEHEPQCVRVVLMFVSQPVLPVLQCANPAAHVHVHVLAAHFGVPFTVLHFVPQPPQLNRSAVVSMQNPEQQLLPFVHEPASPVQISAQMPDGLQPFGAVQSPLPVHSTHSCRFVSHFGDCGLILQSASALQPIVHTRSSVQKVPAAHESGFFTQPTHVFAGPQWR